MNVAKAAVLLVIAAVLGTLGFLYRVTLKRTYNATVKPVLDKTVTAFKTGL